MSVILLDVDGVLADCSKPCGIFLGQYHRPDNWDFYDPETPPEVVAEFWRFFGEPGFCRNLEPFPGAREFVERLREQYEVHFATSPFDCPTWHQERIDWLREHVGARKKEITFTHRKDLMAGFALVDDKPGNHSHTHRYSILFDRPYNRENNSLIRAHSYLDVLRILNA